MLALIKREFEDLRVLFMAGLILLIFLAIIVGFIAIDEYRDGLVVGVPLWFFAAISVLMTLPLVATVFGQIQMYLDRSRGVSTFLSTLATTRKRILLARLIVGLSFITMFFAATAIGSAVLIRLFPTFGPANVSLAVRMSVIAFLINLTAYAIGLQVGWPDRRGFLFIFAGVLGTIVLISLVVIKGFGADTMIILALVTTASLVRTWQRFMITPL